MKHLTGDICATKNGNLTLRRSVNKSFVAYEVNENDTGTRKEEITDGHRRYVEHIANERRRLGLDLYNCDDRVRK